MIESWKWEAIARLRKIHKETPIPGVVLDALFGDYNVPNPPKTPRVWIASQWLAMTVKGHWDAEVISPPHEVKTLKQWVSSFWGRPEAFAYLAAWEENLPNYITWRPNWEGLITQIHPVIWVKAFGATVAVIRAAPKSAVLEVIGGGKYPLTPPAPYNPPEAGYPDGRSSYWEDDLAALLLGRKVNDAAPKPEKWEPILSAVGELQRQSQDVEGCHLVGVAANILAR